MLVSSFCASCLSDTTRRMSATELVLRSSVPPPQQQLRRSSNYLLALINSKGRLTILHAVSLLEVLPAANSRQHLEEGRAAQQLRSVLHILPLGEELSRLQIVPSS